MSATEKLRSMLDERGTEWADESNEYADVTTFIASGVKYTVVSRSYLNPEHDWMTLRAERITPEQVIAATLKNGTCRIVKKWNDWNYKCSECGCFLPVYERDQETGEIIRTLNYCPNCGRKVMVE